MLCARLWSQNIQWAFNVIEYSSEKESNAYAAKQVLGLPNSMPAGRENINSWIPKINKKEQYIKVGFLNPIMPKQIIVAESYSPGQIAKIYVYDADGHETEVASYKNEINLAASKILYVKLKDINFYVFAVKLTFFKDKDVAFGIDAIGISENTKPFVIVSDSKSIIKNNMIATRLNANVNSEYPEMGPLVSPDGQTLYFSRRYDPADMGGKKDEEDIWYSNWDNSLKDWGIAKNMGHPLNNTDPNFINSISPDGNSILLGNSYLADGSMENGVSKSIRTDTGWSTPVRLDIEDEDRNKSFKVNFFESNSQKILLISNNRRADSYGNRDLYVSFLITENKWTKPLNLGKIINTKGTESAPFLAADDKTMYFASDGLAGYGGSDIYMSRRLDDSWTNWSVPENLGPIVNTASDESYLTLDASGTKVYYTSQTNVDSDVDMYTLKLPKIFKPLPVMLIKGKVIDSKTNKAIVNVKIFFENLKTGAEVGIAKSSPDSGNFKIILPSGEKYGYLAEKENYISVHSHIDLANLQEYKEYHQDIYLTPIDTGQTVAFNNIFFDYNKYVLKKESFFELNRLANILVANKNMVIEVSGNTDNIGGVKFNDALSLKRAQAVAAYLYAKNSSILKDRIKLIHNGESKPIATNTTNSGRELNRRVQFKILEK